MRRNRRGAGSGWSLADRAKIRSSPWWSRSYRGPAVHLAAHDGDHGPLAQGGRHGNPGGEDVRAGAELPPAPLAITTPEALPEAIAGRPYAVALAATGGRGPLHWTLGGTCPTG